MPGAGFLGVAYDPFNAPQGGAPPRNAQPGTSTDRFQQRLGLLGRLQEESAESGVRQLVADHQTLYGKASRMILSPQMKAFDLSRSRPRRATTTAAGRSAPLLLARRLVETGVTFIEVTSNNWDTHDNNFGAPARCANRSIVRWPTWSKTCTTAGCSTTRWSL